MAMPAYIRRYTLRIACFMSLYLVTLMVGLNFKHEITVLGKLPLTLVALATALPICGAFWSIYRLIEEIDDEYQRLLMVRQTLLGTALTFAVATCWQFLKVYDVVTRGPEWYGVLWFAMWGLAGPVVRWRA